MSTGLSPPVTAEVASSSLVLPAILFKRLSSTFERVLWYTKRYTLSGPRVPTARFHSGRIISTTFACVRDIVGLYLNPPENAVVLCVDEKRGIQALERTQPMLLLGLSYVEGVTHDYRYHGTTTLLPHWTRFHVHFTPTYASWLNQVEIWFNRITQQALRRGTFSRVKDLVTKIDHYVKNSNRNAQPFVWTATADSIFAKVQRLCERIYRT